MSRLSPAHLRKQQTPGGYVSVYVSFKEKDLPEIDKRALSLGLNRSGFLRVLVEQDLRRPSKFKWLYRDKPRSKPSRTLPGITQDATGALQIDVPVFLEFLALTDTPEHRAAAQKIAGELMSIKRKGN